MTLTGKLQNDLHLREGIRNNLPEKKKSVGNLIYRIIALTIRLIFYINGGMDVKGKNNVPQKGGVIIASNHISYLDPPLIGAVTPRRATFMARKGLFSIPLLGWFIKHYAIPVDREKTDPSTIKESIKRLKSGELLIIFPEGKRSVTGELQEGKRGAGMIASLSGATVVPTFIMGSNKALPFGAKWLKRARITIAFGSPLHPSEISGEGDNLSRNITQKIMLKIGELKKQYADNSS